MNDYISLLRSDAQKVFPGAASVEIFIDAYEVKVTPHYAGELLEKSMKTIDGEWCTKRKAECHLL